MANIRYVGLFALAVIAAVAGVLLQKDDDTPTITFTRPDIPDDTLERQESGVGTANTSIVPLEEPLTSPQGGGVSADGRVTYPIEESLSDQQLADQIALAKAKLARVESLNQRKQALIEETMMQQDDAEQSLLEAEIAYRIGGWRQAWRDGDAHAYFGFYSDDFTPNNGLSMVQWKEQRIKRLNPERDIDLILKDFEVKYDQVTKRSLVTFQQGYKSGSYQDSTKKRLILANENGQWKIVSETSQ